MPDTPHADVILPAPLLTFPEALTSEAAAMLLGGDVGGLKAVQEKLATALAGQGVSGQDAGTLADGWVRSFAAGMGSASTPEAAIAEASRLTSGTAARMAEATQETTAQTGEQRLAAALAQGQGLGEMGSEGSASAMTRALFDGVMDPAARSAGSADPIAALSHALNAPVDGAPAPDANLSPAEKLTTALASGVAVQDAVKALGADGAGLFVETLERALSSGEDAASAVAAAADRASQAGMQTQAVSVEQSDGDRLLTALAAGGAEAAQKIGDGAAFTNVLNDALAGGAAPDMALGASARAQTDMALQQSAAGVEPKPADALVASLASGRNVSETVQSFAAAAGFEAASSGFGQMLGTALSAGQEADRALGTARQDASTANAMAAEAAKGVKGDGLVAALASGQNVQQAVQAAGGAGGAFSAALGQALAEGRSPGQALATARQAADTVQHNSQTSEVPVSAENQALAALATPAAADGAKADTAADGAKDTADGQQTEAAASDDGKDGGKDGEQVAEAETASEDGEKGDGDGNAEKGDGTAEDGGEEAGEAAADASASGDQASADAGTPPASEPAAKPADMAGTAPKPAGFGPPDGGKSASADDGAGHSTTASEARPASTAPVNANTLTADPFSVAAQTQQRATQIVEGTLPGNGTTPIPPVTTPPITNPAIPGDHTVQAPILSPGFDAAAFAKAMAVLEGTATPAGFTVFHLIESMFRPGESGGNVIGVAVVANGGSELGVWQYSVDGSTWLEVGSVGDSGALVLQGSAQLRFLPAAGAYGTAPSLGLRAVNEGWTNGFSGADHKLFALTGTGGVSPLSAEVGQLSLELTPVNGAPVATGSQATLAAVLEDATAAGGASVSSLFGGLFSDPTDTVYGAAGNSFAGVAVVANPENLEQGQWQYWNGNSWTAVGSVSNGSALLLASDSMLRFLPTPNWNGVTPTLTVRLVDDSAGAITSGTRIAVTDNGGTTPYSATTVTLDSSITAVNDAPVALGGAATLPVIAEDALELAGNTVTSLFAALFSDPLDAVSGGSVANLFAGVVVVGNAATASQGAWQYWTGNAWADIGTVAAGRGLLLAADAKLRFLPAEDWNGTTPALTVRLVDDSLGAIASGTRITLSATGGATRYSADTIALTGTVTAVNDAPVATGTAASLPTLAEDATDPAGATITSLFGGLFSDALDAVTGGSAANSLAGVVIVGNAASPSQGTWQYWTGSAWTDVGTVSAGSALVVAATDKLRFVPAENWNGTTPALTVRLVDDSQGAIASGTRITLTESGGTTRYSADTIALTGTVTAVNDAPVATGTAANLPTLAEDATNLDGTTVTSLFGTLFSDTADAVSGGSAANSLAGVVVVGNAASTSQGTWQYWTGTSWTDVGSVSEGSGLLLAADAKLRFAPAADWNGTTPALTVRLVDGSQGAIASGTRIAVTDSGGATRYSADTIALTGTVTAVNDAPVATGTAASLPTIAEDATNLDGTTVTSLFGGLFSDTADAVSGGSAANSLAGVVIVGNAASTSQGTWQYWTGTSWSAVGSVSDSSALLVAATAKLRFVPAADWNGTTPALTVRLVDSSQGTIASGTRIAVTDSGGATRYSADTIALTGTVTAVNDAPQITIDTETLTTLKGVAVAVTGLSISDVDAGSTPLLVNLTAGHGTLTLADGGLDAVITGNGTDSITIRGTLATINSLLGATNGLLYASGSYSGADRINIVVNDQGNSGAGGPLTAATWIDVTVVPPNASPILIDTDLALSVAAEAMAAPDAGTAGIAVSKLVGLNGAGAGNVTDSDPGALTGIALVGTNESYGQWWYSTDGGASWNLVGEVSDDEALLLRATDRLYFQPNAAVPGTIDEALTIRAWDRTTGDYGTKVAVDTSGGSAFSSATDSLTLHPGVLLPNGSFDDGLNGWLMTGGGSVGSTGDGHEGTITSTGGQTPTQLEDFLGLAHGSIAAAAGTTPSFGHAMKFAGTVTVTQDTTLTFDWSFVFSDPGYHDFGFVSVNGVVTLLAKDASASGTFTVVIPANTTLSLGFGTSDTSDNSVNPILRVDNIKLTTVASNPVSDLMSTDGHAFRLLSDSVQLDTATGDSTDQGGKAKTVDKPLAESGTQDGQADSSPKTLAAFGEQQDGQSNATDAVFTLAQTGQDAATGTANPMGKAGVSDATGILPAASPTAVQDTAQDTAMAGSGMTDGAAPAATGLALSAKAVSVAEAPVQAQWHPMDGLGGTDFAALLSSGLGPSTAAPVVHETAALHGAEWMSDLNNPGDHGVAGTHPTDVHST